MSDLNISQSTFQTAAEALNKASGSLSGAKTASPGDLGADNLQSIATESAAQWNNISWGLRDVLDTGSRDALLAAQTFARVDAALADVAKGKNP